MGIPYLYKWLKNKKFFGVLRRNVPQYVSSLSLDANGIIHKCAQLVYAYGEGENPARQKLIAQADPRLLEAEFHNSISTLLHQILVETQPQELLMIAIDGVAPQSKIAQQRQRRFKSAMGNTSEVFDSSCISPGTDFMIRLDNFLQRWIATYQSTLPPKVIYSSHMVPGEGEQKVLDMMRNGNISGSGAHVIYGMDADLIMLSLLAPLDQIFLVREDISDVIDIDGFKNILREELKTSTAIQDFVVMTFTVGNDFLPHMPSLENLDEAIETLLNVYKNTNISLTTENDLNWENLNIYLNNLKNFEHSLLVKEVERGVKYPSRMLKLASKRTEKMTQGTLGSVITFETTLDYNLFRGLWYANELIPKDLSINKVINHNFGVTTAKVVHMCQEYLKGLAWIYNYYIKGGEHINDYVYRYFHTPLLSDISLVLNQIKKVDGYLASPNQVILNPIHQLLCILPLKSAKNLLPKEVLHLTFKDSPIADIYPTDVVIEMDGKNADWQGIALIPFVDASRIIEAVNSTTIFSLERAKLYSQGNNIIIIRDPESAQLDKEEREFRKMLEQKKQQGRGRGRGRGDNRDRDGGRGYRDANRDRDSGRNDNRGRDGGRGYGGRGRDDNKGRGRGRGYIGERGDNREQKSRDDRDDTREITREITRDIVLSPRRNLPDVPITQTSLQPVTPVINQPPFQPVTPVVTQPSLQPITPVVTQPTQRILPPLKSQWVNTIL